MKILTVEDDGIIAMHLEVVDLGHDYALSPQPPLRLSAAGPRMSGFTLPLEHPVPAGQCVVLKAMMITLKPEQQEWLVARGDFRSVEEAARQLIDDRNTELELEGDDLAWAKPYVDEALAAVGRGECVTLEEHRAHMAALLASLGA